MCAVVHLACVLICLKYSMPECPLPAAKLQLPLVAGILHLCCEWNQTLEACGQNYVAMTLSLAPLPLVSFSFSVKLLQTGRQIGNSVPSAILPVVCSLVHFLGFVRSSLPSFPPAQSTTAATIFLL